MRKTLADLPNSPHTTWSALRGRESSLAGAGAGIVSAIVTCPLDLVKTKLQAEGGLTTDNPRYRGLIDTLKKIWLAEGFRGCYRGLGPTLFGYAPTWGIYFATYDGVKQYMVEQRQSHEEDPVVHVVAAIVAGACGTAATNPLWVIKTRFMTQNIADGREKRYRHTWDAMRRIYKHEGLLGFYRGLVPSLFGVTHVAVQFPLYERFKKLNRPPDGSDLSYTVILACSSSSKMIASICTYPHEVIRTRLQIEQARPTAPRAALKQPLRSASTILGLCNNIWHQEGLKGFYRGLSVNLVRTVPSSALTLLTYEVLMRKLVPLTHNTRPR